MDRRITWNRRAVVVGALGIAVLATTGLEAQRWGRPRPPSSGACFYRNADFRGDYFCVPVGSDVDRMPDGLNDRISSIRFFGGAEVTVFRNPDFNGRSSRFYTDVSNLQTEGWNDTLSSISVRRRGGGSGGGWGGGGGGGGWGSSGDPDRIIRRAYQDLLNREPDQNGLREYRRRMIDDGWSEAQVREALRRSPEFRQQNMMTREKAEDIVRRAYQSVLGRDPDPAARSWVDEVMRNRLTQQDIERELRRSPEYPQPQAAAVAARPAAYFDRGLAAGFALAAFGVLAALAAFGAGLAPRPRVMPRRLADGAAPARAFISSMAASSVTASAARSLGSDAFVVPSVTYGP